MHQELENLVNNILSKGELTDRSRELLMKKAEQLGVDAIDFELELEGRFADAKTKTVATPSPPPIATSNKEGTIKKCPSCGASVEAFQDKCKECDHVFRYDSLNTLNKNIQLDVENKVHQISSHVIPINREALIEFLSFSIGNAKNKGLSFEERSAWNSKFTEAYNKAVFSFKDESDKKFLKTLNLDKMQVGFELSRTKEEKEKDNQDTKDLAKNPLMYVLLGVSIFIFYLIYKWLTN